MGANQKDIMNKDLNKAIMVRSELRNKFLRIKTEENRIVYVSQRNFCDNMLCWKKREYIDK